MRRLAAIDIGTNTILLLVADVAQDGKISPLQDVERTTRLGRGLARTGRLDPGPLEQSLRVVHDYMTICRDMKVTEILSAGTSALREAENAEEFLDAAARRFGLRVNIISGMEEARLSYLAVEKEIGTHAPLMVIDIGGGSVELIVGRGGTVCELHSLEMGAVRLTEDFLLSDPVAEEEFRRMVVHITQKFQSLAITPPRGVVGLGGTITTLSAVNQGTRCLDPSRLHLSSLSRRAVNQQVLLYKSMPLNQRRRIPGLPKERADVILAGAAILLGAMDALGFNRLTVSCHGLRYGLIYAAMQAKWIEKGRESC
jgi:exopolyphosphatase/guanosine-5'-triphosphate,3'-diphosphate pyrophosphatase